jgi:hypothetical protein
MPAVSVLVVAAFCFPITNKHCCNNWAGRPNNDVLDCANVLYPVSHARAMQSQAAISIYININKKGYGTQRGRLVIQTFGTTEMHHICDGPINRKHICIIKTIIEKTWAHSRLNSYRKHLKAPAPPPRPPKRPNPTRIVTRCLANYEAQLITDMVSAFVYSKHCKFAPGLQGAKQQCLPFTVEIPQLYKHSVHRHMKIASAQILTH